MTTTKDEAIKIYRDALETLAAQDSGKPGSAALSDCMATWAQNALAATSHIAPDAAAIQAEPAAVDGFIADDGVEHRHPRYGSGVFFTYNSMKSLYEAPPTASPAIAPEASELPPLPEPSKIQMEFDGRLSLPCLAYTAEQLDDYARAAIAMHRAAPVKVAGLGRIWNEEDGFLELQFKDEDAAQAFMQNYEPSVDCRDMPSMHRAAAVTVKLPKWIDNMKGADPTMDSVIEYIEQLLAAAEPVPTSDEAVGWFVETKHADGSATISTVRPGISDSFQLYRRATKPAASEAPKLPHGWVALSIIFDEGMEYPEEVAYGPPAMMDRLGKKLDKYYAHIIATRDAAPIAASEAVGVPGGWHVERKSTGTIIVRHDTIGGCAVRQDDTSIASTILWEFASAIFAAPAAPTDAIPELRNAFMTLESNGGEGRTIVLKFNQRSDAYAVHDFLLKGGTRDYAGTPADARFNNVWNDALEEAAIICDAVNNHDNPMTAGDCADAIRDLKSSPQAPKTEGSGDV